MDLVRDRVTASKAAGGPAQLSLPLLLPSCCHSPERLEHSGCRGRASQAVRGPSGFSRTELHVTLPCVHDSPQSDAVSVQTSLVTPLPTATVPTPLTWHSGPKAALQHYCPLLSCSDIPLLPLGKEKPTGYTTGSGRDCGKPE